MGNPNRQHSRWTTKRMFFSVLGIGLATGALFDGKLDAGHWSLVILGCIAGHHMEDLIRAWRGNAGAP